MMDVAEFFDKYNIPTKTHGENVKRGNINICCPFCRGDEKFHMGVKPSTGQWGCWRDKGHRGGSFPKLVRYLLGVSLEEANEILGIRNVLDPNSLEYMVNNLWVDEGSQDQKSPLGGASICRLDRLFRDIKSTGLTSRFWDYLERRGFDDVDRLVREYGLKCCLAGEWGFRVIFPITYNGALMSWIGRSIYKDIKYLRYKDLDIELSVRHPKYCLYNFDSIKSGGKILFINEGVFDSIKIDFYTPPEYRATNIFTKTMHTEQVWMLQQIAHKYERIIVLLDEDAYMQSWEIKEELAFISTPITFVPLPFDLKDPGEFTKAMLKEWIPTL